MPVRRKPSNLRKRKRTTSAARRRLHNSRRKLVKRGRLARPRGLKPAVHFFTKKAIQTLNLELTDGALPDGTGWTVNANATGNVAITKNFVYNFQSVPNYQQFEAMFTRYKLCAVKVTIVPNVGTASGLQTSGQSMNTSAGGSLQWMGKSVPMVAYVRSNRFGQVDATGWTEERWLGTQNHKRINLKQRGTSFYMPLNMLSDVDAPVSGGGTDYVMKRPQFVSMAETTARHYGYTIRLQAVDSTPFSKLLPSFTIITKFYFQCGGLQV